MRLAATRKPSTTKSPNRLADFDKCWRHETLPNGLEIIHVPMPDDDRFLLLSVVGVGSRHEDAASCGISHFVEHMMFRGSGLHPDYLALAEAFEVLGGEWNASTTEEYTEYYYQGIERNAPEAIRLFADFLERPQLNDIEVERQVIEREIEGETNEFGESTDLGYHIASLIWPGSPLARPIVGTNKTLAALDIPALKLFLGKHYTPRNTVICAVGGKSDDSMLSLLREHFSEFRKVQARVAPPRVKTPDAFAGPACKVVRNTDNQYHVQLSFLTEGRWSKKRPGLIALSRLLADGFASRMARRLRDELGLVYEFDADVDCRVDTGTLDISASVGLSSPEAFLRELLAILRQLKESGPTAAELDRVVRRSLVDLELMPTDPSGVGFDTAWAVLHNQKPSLLARHAAMAKLTIDSVQKAARELFVPARAALVLLGPEDSSLEAHLADLLSRELK